MRSNAFKQWVSKGNWICAKGVRRGRWVPAGRDKGAWKDGCEKTGRERWDAQPHPVMRVRPESVADLPENRGDQEGCGGQRDEDAPDQPAQSLRLGDDRGFETPLLLGNLAQ